MQKLSKKEIEAIKEGFAKKNQFITNVLSKKIELSKSCGKFVFAVYSGFACELRLTYKTFDAMIIDLDKYLGAL